MANGNPNTTSLHLHEHRRPSPFDFEGKRVTMFECECDNIWRIWFDDGSAFAIQCEATHDGIAFMELCDECLATEETNDVAA